MSGDRCFGPRKPATRRDAFCVSLVCVTTTMLDLISIAKTVIPYRRFRSRVVGLKRETPDLQRSRWGTKVLASHDMNTLTVGVQCRACRHAAK